MAQQQQQQPQGPPTHIMGDSMEDLMKTMAGLNQVMHGYWLTQICYVVAELGVPDLLKQHGPQTAEDLASKLGCDASRLFRVLRAFQTIGGFTIDEHNKFGLTILSKLFLSDHPMSQRAVARLNGTPERYGSWMYLLDMVKGGEIGWIQHNKMDIYEYLNHNAKHAEIFNTCMTSYSNFENPPLIKSYDFSLFGTVADVGGGEGSLIVKIMARYPTVKGMIVDRPEVQEENEKKPVLASVKKVGTDFFAPGGVPSGADAYILKNVVHDHLRDNIIKLLKNIHAALKESTNPNKCVLIMEHIISTDYTQLHDRSKLLDLTFLVLSNAQERTQAEYEELLNASGFTLSRTIPTGQGRYIIEAKPVYD